MKDLNASWLITSLVISTFIVQRQRRGALLHGNGEKFYRALIPVIFLFLGFVGEANATTWYVRPAAAGGLYGAEDGTSYNSAFNGWSDIVWGPSGVSASDTLYICGSHNYDSTVSLNTTGSGSGTKTIVSGSCPEETGTITFTGLGFLNVNRDYFIIKDITINAADGQSGIFHYERSFITYDNISINGGARGILFSTSDGKTMVGNTITNSSFSRQTGQGIRWLVTDASTNTLRATTITNNTFTNISGTAVELRSESDAPNGVLSAVTISGNSFSGCGFICIWALGQGQFSSFGWDSVIIQNNTIDSAFGGMAVGGFGATGYGSNVISNNIITNTTGATGGINVFYTQYLDVYGNTINGGTTTTIDGNGILIDHGNNYTKVYNNTVSGMRGKSGVDNSGVGVMVLDSKNVTVHHNKGMGNRIGFWLGIPQLHSENVEFYNNTFLNNTEAGLWISSGVDEIELAKLEVKNNILTGDGTGFGLYDLSTGGGDSNWDYNLLYLFPQNYQNHNPGANDIVGDPLLVSLSNFYPQSNSPVIDKGVSVGLNVDFDGNPIYGTPDIGAYEYQDPDHDGVLNSQDNCPTAPNSTQTDSNGNGVGDTCDPVDLSLTLTDTPDPALQGDTVTYTLTATNTGPSAASDVIVSGTLPVCTLGAIASGASVNCIRTVIASTVGTLTQSLSVSANETDPTPTNNTATVSTTVIAPDLTPTAMSISKSGSKVSVSDTVRNQGNANAGAFTVKYYLSTDTAFSSNDLALATASGGSTACTRTVASLNVGISSGISNKPCYRPAGVVTGIRYYVLAVDDADKQVIESNEVNNVRATAGTVKW